MTHAKYLVSTFTIGTNVSKCFTDILLPRSLDSVLAHTQCVYNLHSLGSIPARRYFFLFDHVQLIHRKQGKVISVWTSLMATTDFLSASRGKGVSSLYIPRQRIQAPMSWISSGMDSP